MTMTPQQLTAKLKALNDKKYGNVGAGLNLLNAMSAYTANPNASTVVPLYKISKQLNPSLGGGNSTTAKSANVTRANYFANNVGATPANLTAFRALQKDPQYVALHNATDAQMNSGPSFAQTAAMVALMASPAIAAQMMAAAPAAATIGATGTGSIAAETGAAGAMNLGGGAAGGSMFAPATGAVSTGTLTTAEGLGATLGAGASESLLSQVMANYGPTLANVAKYGGAAMKLIGGISGMGVSSKQSQLANQAYTAAQAGNQQALTDALDALKRDINLRRGAAYADMGNSGFMTSGGGGTFLDAIDNRLASDQTLQQRFLQNASDNQRAQFTAQLGASQLQAQQTKGDALSNLILGAVGAAPILADPNIKMFG